MSYIAPVIMTVMWIACIAAALSGAYAGIVRGTLYWPAGIHAPRRVSGISARIGGVAMLFLVFALLIPIIRALRGWEWRSVRLTYRYN